MEAGACLIEAWPREEKSALEGVFVKLPGLWMNLGDRPEVQLLRLRSHRPWMVSCSTLMRHDSLGPCEGRSVGGNHHPAEIKCNQWALWGPKLGEATLPWFCRTEAEVVQLWNAATATLLITKIGAHRSMHWSHRMVLNEWWDDIEWMEKEKKSLVVDQARSDSRQESGGWPWSCVENWERDSRMESPSAMW